MRIRHVVSLSALLIVLTSVVLVSQAQERKARRVRGGETQAKPEGEAKPSTSEETPATKTEGEAEEPEKPGALKKVIKTDKEWARILSQAAFLVARKKGTEPAFSGKYHNYHGKGVFACVCCGTVLFDTRHKFDSGTGWPSFFRPVANNRVVNHPDYSYGMQRVEVVCTVCDAHLGHVFNDGPPPTGLRYCINSVSLKLVQPSKTPPKKKSDPSAKKADEEGETAPASEEAAEEPKATKRKSR